MNNNRPKHDQLFRKALENPMVAHELLQTHMPSDVFALMDMSTLKLEKESFVETDLTNSISDVLFSAKFNGDDGYIHILLEHQSSADHFMAFRLFKYMINICDRHLRLNPKAKQLPLVYPLIIFNGSKTYNAARNIWELFTDKTKAKQFWTEDHKVVNVREIPDEELKKRVWSGILEFFLKHIHERNLLKRWQEVKDLLPELIKVRIGRDYLETVLYYTLTHIEKKDKMELKELLRNSIKKDGEELMTSLAEAWLQDGIKIGEAKGIAMGKAMGEARGRAIGEERKSLEIAKRMLANGLELEFVSSVTGLDKKLIIKAVA